MTQLFPSAREKHTRAPTQLSFRSFPIPPPEKPAERGLRLLAWVPDLSHRTPSWEAARDERGLEPRLWDCAGQTWFAHLRLPVRFWHDFSHETCLGPSRTGAWSWKAARRPRKVSIKCGLQIICDHFFPICATLCGKAPVWGRTRRVLYANSHQELHHRKIKPSVRCSPCDPQKGFSFVLSPFLSLIPQLVEVDDKSIFSPDQFAAIAAFSERLLFSDFAWVLVTRPMYWIQTTRSPPGTVKCRLDTRTPAQVSLALFLLRRGVLEITESFLIEFPGVGSLCSNVQLFTLFCQRHAFGPGAWRNVAAKCCSKSRTSLTSLLHIPAPIFAALQRRAARHTTPRR